MDYRIQAIVALFCLAVFTSDARAHRPNFGLSYDSAERAFQIEDPEVSIVLYQPVTCESDQLWLTFEAQEGHELFFQLGVPVMDRLQDYRPAIALLAPGLPEPLDDLPFEVPEGHGALVYFTDQVAEPDVFHEEFTQTSSWILAEETVILPASGKGYLVGWDPARWTGKIWIAVGTLEDFNGVSVEQFVEWDHQVKDFHEVGDHSHEAEELAEQQCPLEAGGDDSGGCSTAGRTGLGLALAGLLALGLVFRSRRRRNQP